MLEVLRYIAYIALNACVKYCTKDQSNVEGVEGTLYRFQMLCNAVYVEDGVCGFYTTLYTEYRSDVKGVKDNLDRVASQSSKCTWSIFDIFNML